MRFDTVISLFGGFIVLAMITDIVSSKNTASIVTSGGNAWANITNSALGKG